MLSARPALSLSYAGGHAAARPPAYLPSLLALRNGRTARLLVAMGLAGLLSGYVAAPLSAIVLETEAPLPAVTLAELQFPQLAADVPVAAPSRATAAPESRAA